MNPPPFPARVRLALHRCIVAILLCSLLPACSTLRPVPANDPAALGRTIQPGDTVTCTLRDGTTRTFKVVTMESAALIGENERVALADVTKLEVNRFSLGKTTLTAGAVVLVAIGALLVWVNQQTPSDRDGNDTPKR